MIGSSTQSGFSFGDQMFWGLGISPWSNGQFGFHYPIIVTVILLITGVIIAKTEVPPRRIGVLILFLVVLSPMIVSILKPVYFKMHRGLGAIEYEYKKSHIEIRSTEDNKNLEVIGSIVLTNYGKHSLNVGIKISSDGYVQQEWFSNDVILTGGNISEQSGVFTLFPGKTQTISTLSTIPSINGTVGGGTMNGPNLILFTDKEMRKVGYNL
jgi:hypothetical protein